MKPDAIPTKVLVVEDECLIAMDLQCMLNDAGYEVLGPVSSVAAALEIISGGEVMTAILDANLDGESSTTVASALTKSKVPYLVVTGYDLQNLPIELQAKNVVQKPYDSKVLLLKLELMIRSARH